MTFLLVVLSRRLELAIMHKNGVQSHSDYAQLIKVTTSHSPPGYLYLPYIQC